MSERALPITDGAPACPFVAFDDDRDARSSAPDHRHRCFAEQPPASRALAHQDAYCLSSAFPVCPAFQDWARREAAPARPRPGAPEPVGAQLPRPPSPPASAGSSAAFARPEADLTAGTAADDDARAPVVDGPGIEAWTGRGTAPVNPASQARPQAPQTAQPPRAAQDRGRLPSAAPHEPGRRPIQRDWAAPPPWTADELPLPEPGEALGGDAGVYRQPVRDGRGDPSRGLAGSEIDRLAGPEPAGPAVRPSGAFRPEVVRPVGLLPGLTPQPPAASPFGEPPARNEPVGRLPVDPAAVRGIPESRGREPYVSRDAHEVRPAGDLFGPGWEGARRYEAYPTLRTRVGLPSFAGLPPAGVGAIALVVAALVLFFIGPMLLGIGGKGTGVPSPSPTASVAPTPTPLPTDTPAPTAQTYIVVKGDTMVKIAAKFGITVAQLMAANPQVKNPNKIAEGQQLNIPVPVATAIQGVPGASPTDSSLP